MTIPDLIKDFIDTSKERLKNPVAGAFLWSFIIFNWRPLLFLLFSDESIENKIIVINFEYCTYGALGWPLLLSVAYTLGLPRVMLKIEQNLANTKDERVTARYKAREHLVEQKKIVAKAEFDLKNIESGSQTIDELNDQIEGLKNSNKTLQESIKQITESSKVTVDELNNSLTIARERNAELTRYNMVPQSKGISDIEVQNADELNAENELARAQFKALAEKAKVSNGTLFKILNISKTLTKTEFTALRNLAIKDKKVIIESSKELHTIKSLVIKGVLYEQVVSDGISYTITTHGTIIKKILMDASAF